MDCFFVTVANAMDTAGQIAHQEVGTLTFWILGAVFGLATLVITLLNSIGLMLMVRIYNKLDEGEKRMALHDTRIALIEQECGRRGRATDGQGFDPRGVRCNGGDRADEARG